MKKTLFVLLVTMLSSAFCFAQSAEVKALQGTWVLIGPAGEGKLSYNLQGKLLIVHEGGYAFIYRKK